MKGTESFKSTKFSKTRNSTSQVNYPCVLENRRYKGFCTCQPLLLLYFSVDTVVPNDVKKHKSFTQQQCSHHASRITKLHAFRQSVTWYLFPPCGFLSGSERTQQIHKGCKSDQKDPYDKTTNYYQKQR